MRPELDDLIGRFREAQDRAVHTLVQESSLPHPQSNLAWVMYCVENRLYERHEFNSVGFRAHGFGWELTWSDVIVDFDWGDRGEPDGFDGWRLWIFRTNNRLALECTHAEVDAWLEEARVEGTLIKQGFLYYDPTRRAPAH